MAYDAAQLMAMTQEQLDDLFKASPAGDIPNGQAEGTAIIAPGTNYSENIAAVMEDLDVRSAMRRSKQLVEGRKGRIFLLLLLLFALYCVAGALQFPFALLLLRARSAEHVIGQVSSLLVAFLCSSLIAPVASIALTLFYIDERVRREAFDIEFLMDRISPPPPSPIAGDAGTELA